MVLYMSVEGNTNETNQRNKNLSKDGELAQLGERLPYKQRVRGSSPLLSTMPT